MKLDKCHLRADYTWELIILERCHFRGDCTTLSRLSCTASSSASGRCNSGVLRIGWWSSLLLVYTLRHWFYYLLGCTANVWLPRGAILSLVFHIWHRMKYQNGMQLCYLWIWHEDLILSTWWRDDLDCPLHVWRQHNQRAKTWYMVPSDVCKLAWDYVRLANSWQLQSLYWFQDLNVASAGCLEFGDLGSSSHQSRDSTHLCEPSLPSQWLLIILFGETSQNGQILGRIDSMCQLEQSLAKSWSKEPTHMPVLQL